jgi:carbon monoxide dehydrogenase subunit G
MAGVSRTVVIPRPPEEVFGWLLDADRVPRWMSGVSSYEVTGPLGPGSRVRQRLEVSGQTVDVDMEIVRYEPPRAAETRFETNGIDVVNVYTLEGDGDGTRFSYENEFKPPGGFIGNAASRVLVGGVPQREANRSLQRLKALLERR